MTDATLHEPGFVPFDAKPTPTADDLRRRDLPPERLDVCLLFLEHAVNVDEVPDPDSRPDVFTDDGYLVVLGFDRGTYDLVVERRPWPTGLVDALRELLA